MPEGTTPHSASLFIIRIGSLRIWPAVLILLLTASPRCADSRMMREIADRPTGSQAFFDDNTLWVKTNGHPKAGIADQAKRKASAREAAVLSAQHMAIQHLTGYTVEGAYGAFSINHIARCMKTRFNETVKNGTIIRETYDSNDICGIVYIVKSPKLKSKIFECISEDK